MRYRISPAYNNALPRRSTVSSRPTDPPPTPLARRRGGRTRHGRLRRLLEPPAAPLGDRLPAAPAEVGASLISPPEAHRAPRSGAGRRGSAACIRVLQPFRAIVPAMGFEWAYRNGVPPWDIGRAQPAIVRLAEEGLIAGDVIDVGSGTGENALYLASRGLAVVGVDAAPTAIAQAQEKARQRGSSATFLVTDALALEGLRRTFDVAIDCGLRCRSSRARSRGWRHPTGSAPPRYPVAGSPDPPWHAPAVPAAGAPVANFHVCPWYG